MIQTYKQHASCSGAQLVGVRFICLRLSKNTGHVISEMIVHDRQHHNHGKTGDYRIADDDESRLVSRLIKWVRSRGKSH
jgi:hypothetical protein